MPGSCETGGSSKREGRTETEHNELKASWEVQVKKLDITRKIVEEMENQAEALRKVLKDKGGKISSLKENFHQARVDGKMKFCNFNGFLAELGGCYADGFNECPCQVKALFPYLDVPRVSLDKVAQTLARSVESESTDKLFEADPIPDAHDDGGTAP